MADDQDAKEKKRRKMFKRMGKILATAWQLPGASPFQDDGNDDDGNDDKKKSKSDKASSLKGFNLTKIGQKVDQKAYRGIRHAWEEFAADLGKVYNSKK